MSLLLLSIFGSSFGFFGSIAIHSFHCFGHFFSLTILCISSWYFLLTSSGAILSRYPSKPSIPSPLPFLSLATAFSNSFHAHTSLATSNAFTFSPLGNSSIHFSTSSSVSTSRFCFLFIFSPSFSTSGINSFAVTVIPPSGFPSFHSAFTLVFWLTPCIASLTDPNSSYMHAPVSCVTAFLNFSISLSPTASSTALNSSRALFLSIMHISSALFLLSSLVFAALNSSSFFIFISCHFLLFVSCSPLHSFATIISFSHFATFSRHLSFLIALFGGRLFTFLSFSSSPGSVFSLSSVIASFAAACSIVCSCSSSLSASSSSGHTFSVNFFMSVIPYFSRSSSVFIFAAGEYVILSSLSPKLSPPKCTATTPLWSSLHTPIIVSAVPIDPASSSFTNQLSICVPALYVAPLACPVIPYSSTSLCSSRSAGDTSPLAPLFSLYSLSSAFQSPPMIILALFSSLSALSSAFQLGNTLSFLQCLTGI